MTIFRMAVSMKQKYNNLVTILCVTVVQCTIPPNKFNSVKMQTHETKHQHFTNSANKLYSIILRDLQEYLPMMAANEVIR